LPAPGFEASKSPPSAARPVLLVVESVPKLGPPGCETAVSAAFLESATAAEEVEEVGERRGLVEPW